MPVVLSIAGSDNCGGAGIQADLKTCMACGVYCATVVTAVTAQNHRGLLASSYVGDDMLRAQLEATLDAVRPDAVKIGMIPVTSAIEIVADTLKTRSLDNVVIDTPLKATSGGELAENFHSHVKVLIDRLFSFATIITPNLPEMRLIMEIAGEDDDVETLMRNHNIKNLLLKGGHGEGDVCTDLLYSQEDTIKVREYSSERIDSRNTHGTGCTLSSAIAAGLAKGFTLDVSVARAKDYLTGCIKRAADSILFADNGPLYH